MNRNSRALWIVLLLLAATAAAQTVAIDALISARDCRELFVRDGMVYGGLIDGGVLFWPEDDPTDVGRWTTVDGLAGNIITDITWSGRAFWIASSGTGLTRVEPRTGGPSFRTITNLGDDLDVSAVAAVLQGANERVHFGLESGGVGIITGGLPGEIATTSNTPGLVSDAIRDLLFVGDDLWIGTAAGVSLLRNGLYSDAGAGLNGRGVRKLLTDSTGRLYAATSGGVFERDGDSGVWSRVGDLTSSLLDAAFHDGFLWVLINGSTTVDRIGRWDGVSWTTQFAPQARIYALAAGDALWSAGSLFPALDNAKARRAWFAKRIGSEWAVRTPDALVFAAVDGVSIAPDGTVWMGDHAAGGFAGWDGTTLEQFYELAETAPDSVGLFNDDGPLLDVAVDADGAVWALQFERGGVLRYQPATGEIDHLSRDNTPLVTNHLLRIVHHPDGAVLLLSDRNGVDVLADPDSWRSAAAWARPSTAADGLGGVNVQDAYIEARDRIWLAVRPAGVVLWDPNGSAGADAPLTWDDPSDDFFSEPIASLPGTNFAFDSVIALAAADDGTLWVAGSNGVVHVRIGPGSQPAAGAVLLHGIREKTDASVTGLVRGDILDLVLDRNGDAWVCHIAGLDRIRLRNDVIEIDPYVGLAAYLAFGLDGYYGPAALAGLPEGQVRSLAVSADGHTVVAGSDGGAILIDVGPRESGSGPLDPLFVYPNPLLPAEHEGLRLGGISAEVTYTSTALLGGASVSLYNVEGQLVWRRDNVANDEVFWEGTNLSGEPVASGVYIARIELGGQVAVVPLSVVQ